MRIITLPDCTDTPMHYWCVPFQGKQLKVFFIVPSGNSFREAVQEAEIFTTMTRLQPICQPMRVSHAIAKFTVQAYGQPDGQTGNSAAAGSPITPSIVTRIDRRGRLKSEFIE